MQPGEIERNLALPLSGRRILVTRAAQQAGKLSEGLRALGAEPVEVPVLEIGPLASYEVLDTALRNLSSYDWLVFTSANAVRAALERAVQIKVAPPQSGRLRIAAVGEATAESLRYAGMHVDYLPQKYVAESLIEHFPEHVNGKRILLARAAVARDVIPDALRASGATVDVAEAYRNTIPAGAADMLKRALERPLHAATFTSSSTVTHLALAARNAGVPFPLKVPAISIGPVTSQTLRECGWEPAAEADPHDVPGLVAAVKRHFSTKT